MFQKLVRRISHSFFPRADRPWNGDGEYIATWIDFDLALRLFSYPLDNVVFHTLPCYVGSDFKFHAILASSITSFATPHTPMHDLAFIAFMLCARSCVVFSNLRMPVDTARTD